MKLPFKYKFIVSFAIVELFFLTLIISFNYNSIKNTSEELLNDKIEVSSKLFTNLVKTPMMIYDLATLDSMVNMFASTKDIFSVVIKDNQNRELSSYYKDKKQYQNITNNENFISNQNLVKIDDKVIGNIQIIFNITNTKNQINDITNNILIIALIEVILSIFVSYFIGNNLSKSIEKLHHAVYKISEDENSNIDLKINSNDEFEYLSKSFMIMRDKIKDRTEKLKQLNQSLEDMVKEKTKELRDINIHLENRVLEEVEKNREKDRLLFEKEKQAQMGAMLGVISHQWKQPLSRISISASKDLLNLQMGEDVSNKDLIDTFNDIITTVKYINDTTHEFITFFDPNKIKELTSLNKTVEKALFILDVKLHNIEISKNYGDLKEIYIHPNEIMQVIINIVSNILENFTILKIDEKHRFISISTYKEDTFQVIDIYDNGGGIKEDIINKIFDANFSTKNNKSSGGIGLNLSKIIAKKHEGNIFAKNIEFEYKNNLCKGANFKIMLSTKL